MNIKKHWFQIVAWIICAVVAFNLYNLVRSDQKKNAERYAQMQLQAAEIEETDTQKLETQIDIYDRLYAQVDVRSIICWGDNAMAGNNTISLPTVLKRVIEENLFSGLQKTFSHVFEDGEYSIPSVTVNNMGVTNEGMRQILVRAGVNTMEVGERIDIPWSTDPVTIRMMDDEAWSKLSDKNKEEQLKFAKQKKVSFGKVWINDVRGSLVTTDDWFDSNHPRYAFVRKEEGDNTRVDARTEIEIETATKYLGDIPVFFFEDDSGRSVDGFVSDIESLVNRYAINSQSETEGGEPYETEEKNVQKKSYDLPFVVIVTTIEDSDLDKALEKEFGERYIRNDGYASEMTERTYKKLAQQIYDNLDQQGCFTDVQAQIMIAIEEADNL